MSTTLTISTSRLDSNLYKNPNSDIFLTDKFKCSLRYRSTMEWLSKDGIMPEKVNIPCWWCRARFNTQPIGCPVDKISDDEYIVEGIFCSFNCVKAFVINEKLKNSVVFITDISGLDYIKESPSWKLLEDNGGSLSREEYFSGNSFLPTNIKTIVQHCTSEKFEECSTLLA